VAPSESSAPTRPSAAVRRPPARRAVPLPWLKPGIFIGGLAPVLSILMRANSDTLSANPVAQIENELGLTALIFLVASLACTPARWLFKWTWPQRVRRELGLFAFFYAALHVGVYLLPDQWLDLRAIVDDVVKRPFITVGLLAFLLMIPLAITSTSDSVRRLGFRRWTRLHQLAYLAGVLAAIHFIWRVKIDVSQPLTYASVLGLLLAVRLVFWLRQRQATPPAPRGGQIVRVD
jgi:methionine sulfoxide reductase heme-binding subunit